MKKIVLMTVVMLSASLSACYTQFETRDSERTSRQDFRRNDYRDDVQTEEYTNDGNTIVNNYYGGYYSRFFNPWAYNSACYDPYWNMPLWVSVYPYPIWGSGFFYQSWWGYRPYHHYWGSGWGYNWNHHYPVPYASNGFFNGRRRDSGRIRSNDNLRDGNRPVIISSPATRTGVAPSSHNRRESSNTSARETTRSTRVTGGEPRRANRRNEGISSPTTRPERSNAPSSPSRSSSSNGGEKHSGGRNRR